MYTTAFLLGIFTSFGWWSAAKIQKQIDNPKVELNIEIKKEN